MDEALRWTEVWAPPTGQTTTDTWSSVFRLGSIRANTYVFPQKQIQAHRPSQVLVRSGPEDVVFEQETGSARRNALVRQP